MVILAGLTLLAMFKTHDYFIYKSNPLPVGVTFPSINFQKIDEKFRYMVAYLINYAFVKFGLEVRNYPVTTFPVIEHYLLLSGSICATYYIK